MKIVFSIVVVCLLFISQPGCGSGGNDVVEAPAAAGDDPAMEGMSDADYDKAMEDAMNSDD